MSSCRRRRCGPVGLLTAIEVTLGGARAVVLERLPEPSLLVKALGLGPLGIEALRRRGMADAIDASESRNVAALRKPTQAASRPSRFSGHFAGLVLLRSEVQREPERRMRFVGQRDLEALLTDRARALGIEIRRACAVTGFTQQADGVDVEWSTPSGRGVTTCRHLVGCDGGHSIVRKRAGFAFPGTPPTLTMYQAFVEIDEPERLPQVGWQRTPGGTYSYGVLPGRLFMLDFSGPPADRLAAVTREEIEAVLQRVSGTDVRVKTLDSASRWTDNTRLVDTYRDGRVFLAGDAAHVHSPFGGQGLGLGLVDAANLGWKLAAVARGDMPDRLLDTYTAERRPVAETVLGNTRAQVAIMRPDPQADAMRDIVAKLMDLDDANRLIADMMSGLSIRYELGSDRDDVGRLLGDRPVRCGGADVALYDLMQGANGVLLDASSGREASRVVASTASHVRCVAVDAGPSMLIRPDACVAWAGEDGSVHGLDESLGRWFGPIADEPASRGEALAEIRG